MNFLVDHQLPPALAAFFRERGCEAEHVSDLGMEASSDSEILEYATAREQIIASKDEDFFYLCRRPGSKVRLLWIRLGNCRTGALLNAIAVHWPDIAACFEAGDRIVEIR